MSAHLLLCLRVAGYIFKMFQIKREPQLSAFGLSAAHIQEFLPFNIANLRTLYRTPVSPVTVDCAFTCNCIVPSCTLQWVITTDSRSIHLRNSYTICHRIILQYNQFIMVYIVISS